MTTALCEQVVELGLGGPWRHAGEVGHVPSVLFHRSAIRGDDRLAVISGEA
jgi:hypothetical protein